MMNWSIMHHSFLPKYTVKFQQGFSYSQEAPPGLIPLRVLFNLKVLESLIMSTVTVDERTPLENYSRCPPPPSHTVLDS